MELLDRRKLLISLANPDTSLDYLVSISGTIEKYMLTLLYFLYWPAEDHQEDHLLQWTQILCKCNRSTCKNARFWNFDLGNSQQLTRRCVRDHHLENEVQPDVDEEEEVHNFVNPKPQRFIFEAVRLRYGSGGEGERKDHFQPPQLPTYW